MEPQGRKKDLTVSCYETKHETTSPQQDHSITSARSNGWAECRDKNVSAPSRRRRMSLDIPFYRTFPICALTNQFALKAPSFIERRVRPDLSAGSIATTLERPSWDSR